MGNIIDTLSEILECNLTSFLVEHLVDYNTQSPKHYEPSHEKIDNLGFWPGLTHTSLYNYRKWLEA